VTDPKHASRVVRGEAVSLAQVVRLVTLARALDPARYQIHFASAHFDEMIFANAAFTRHAVHSLPARTVDRRVASGRRPYGRRTLARYVREELALFDGACGPIWWSAIFGCRWRSRPPSRRSPTRT
jgi:UDP:flavonoid glycosyltransferase YjiC (YdhE family)